NLRYWRFNNRDESYWILNHFVAWHRFTKTHLAPGEMTVLEISATVRDFGPGNPYLFNLVDETWEPCLGHQGLLQEDPVNVSFIRVLPGMQDLEISVRHTGRSALTFTDLALIGFQTANVEWRGKELSGPGNAIARVKLTQPVAPSKLLIVRVGVKTDQGERAVYAHRRAFADYFPIGTWGMETEIQEWLKADHVDLGILGGKRTDPFFSETWRRLGLRAAVHTGEPVDVDMVRDLSGHQAVACWMLRDEPDWSTPASVMLFCDQTVRQYDSKIPTFINLCRNAKFFDYAGIPDIVGHDHYSVTAPSSSKWPHEYGTRLEETAYYTSDLKYASEPRPIWVWSQGNHDGWGERPLRPVPTPEELSAQLVLNLGRAAKGILWFTYNPKMSVKYPETRESMRGWNRVMNVLRDDLLAAEPIQTKISAPNFVDAAALVSWDKALVFVTNLDYDIDPRAYPFRAKSNVKVALRLPDWIAPTKALRVAGDGVSSVPVAQRGGETEIAIDQLADSAIVVLTGDTALHAALEAKYRALREGETDAVPITK
ncbi:MAG: hypothetical protein IT366_02765, partial [Candidatus Hydrogenedentes bacterium]|nr:hypothetical protein [Candidatus Hydrogenedentota bacterium]